MIFFRFTHRKSSLQETLHSLRLYSTANGTTMFTRILTMAFVLIPVLCGITLIHRSREDQDVEKYVSSPGVAFFISAFVFSVLPCCWILFNPELRDYVFRKTFKIKKRNSIHPTNMGNSTKYKTAIN